MNPNPEQKQYLLSIPPSGVNTVEPFENLSGSNWFTASDPKGRRLGSGGGTVYLLLAAWQQMGRHQSFTEWLNASQKLMIHGGGQSRRLPAYAPAGKLFTPLPVWRWSTGQQIDQSLLDLQRPYLEKIYQKASSRARLMVASGDVLVRFSETLPDLPDVDVLCIGLWGKPEDAQHFGVFFCPRTTPEQLSFFKQKPTPEQIRDLTNDHAFLLDAGIWLFSERAVHALLQMAGWQGQKDALAELDPETFELYSDYGLALGNTPSQPHAEINDLSTAVVSLDDGQFYHFGRSSDLIDSCLRLQNLVLDQREMRTVNVKKHPDLFVQNAVIHGAWQPHHHRIWVENACVGANWVLTNNHVITNVPENDWHLKLEPGVCLDLVPIDGEDQVVVRTYGINDAFRGQVAAANTMWLGEQCQEWFAKRHMDFEQTRISPVTDIQQAPLFVCVSTKKLNEKFLQWLVALEPESNPDFKEMWLNLPRLSAEELGDRADLNRIYMQRKAYLRQNLPELAANFRNSVFYRTDLRHMATLYFEEKLPLPDPIDEHTSDLMDLVHDQMFRAEILRRRHDAEWEAHENKAFAMLQSAAVEPMKDVPVQPQYDVAVDQIVWARCPVRLDLAGGWSDTPPYCQLHGGSVVNLATNLNGQPPLQAFVKRAERPVIVLRSIDLGVETTLRSYDDIGNYAKVGNEFSIAKAALALAGFQPHFCKTAFKTLQEQLRYMGGGLEVSFVAAVPKGSGLGTSSILAATILGALNDFCALNWDINALCNRVLVLEQMLTSGGGWQDQFGGALHGMKLLETKAGIDQTPTTKWLPEHLLQEGIDNNSVLLYYTGITRVAKGILQEIVRGMFLNDNERLRVLGEIRDHAATTYDIIQRANWEGLAKAVGRSWQLNQQLDKGTNPEPVQALFSQIDDYLAGAKLLGAGGGGYLLMIAKDADAAHRVKAELQQNPPNPGARFVDIQISHTGLQVTRS